MCDLAAQALPGEGRTLQNLDASLINLREHFVTVTRLLTPEPLQAVDKHVHWTGQMFLISTNAKTCILLSCPAQDALQESYKKEGKYPGPTIVPRRRPWTLLNFMFWATLLLSPLINFACGVVVSGSPLLIIGFIVFLIIGR